MLKLLISFVLAFWFGSGAMAASPYVRIQLPQGVSVELPRNWTILSDSQQVTLDAWVKTVSEKASREKTTSELGFASSLYDDKGNTIGIVNVRYYADQSVTQLEATTASLKDVAELDATLRANIKSGIEANGNRVLDWNGTQKIIINGMTFFVSEYRRTSPQNSPFRVKLVRLLDGSRSFTVTISYREDERYFLAPISDRVVESIRR